MSSTNKVQLIGNLGSNPKLVQTSETNTILSVSMATHEKIKKENGEKETKTEWHNLVAFGKIANLINQHLKKGSKLMISGKLQTRQYTNKDGVEKHTTEIVVNEVLFLDSIDTNQA